MEGVVEVEVEVELFCRIGFSSAFTGIGLMFTTHSDGVEELILDDSEDKLDANSVFLIPVSTVSLIF